MTLRLAEAIYDNWQDSYESGNSGRTYYTCRYCGGYGVPDPLSIEHDSECAYLLARDVLLRAD